MNKKIKRIVAIALTISAFSIIEPTKYINLTNTVKASATAKGADLKEISLGQGSIDFKRTITAYTLNLKASVKELKVSAKPRESDAEVEIDGTEVYESDNYKKVVQLDKGENTIIIKVKNGSVKRTYTLTVNRGTSDAEKEIYLSDIELSAGDINFSKETTSYDVDVKSDINKISIKAKPEDEDYDVEIDRVTVNSDDNYKKTVSLNSGNNEIKIEMQDDDDHEKVYTLNINRAATNTQIAATAASTTSATNTQNTNTTQIVKGWILRNGSWYYLDENGTMKNGWQLINGEWYYLDSSGTMKTGWFKNTDNKWYYLYESGVMAKNTTIGGFKLSSTGAWIQ